MGQNRRRRLHSGALSSIHTYVAVHLSLRAGRRSPPPLRRLVFDLRAGPTGDAIRYITSVIRGEHFADGALAEAMAGRIDPAGAGLSAFLVCNERLPEGTARGAPRSIAPGRRSDSVPEQGTTRAEAEHRPGHEPARITAPTSRSVTTVRAEAHRSPVPRAPRSAAVFGRAVRPRRSIQRRREAGGAQLAPGAAHNEGVASLRDHLQIPTRSPPGNRHRSVLTDRSITFAR